MSHRSEQIDQLAASLSKAQGSYKKLAPNELCAGGKFANLEAILAATVDSLSANGLAIYQHIDLLDEGSGAALLKTELIHSSGQWISSTARVIAGKTDRQTGNVYEIHKRMHVSMLLGIAPSKNDPFLFDDNGDELADNHLIEKLKKPQEEVKLDYEETISKEQYTDLMIELDGHPDIVKDIFSIYGITTLQDLPKSEYHKSLGKIRKIKKTLDDYSRKR